MTSTDDSRPRLSMHEDDWRQVEFVSANLLPQIDTELAAIGDILANARQGPGFNRIHVRKRLPQPMSQPMLIDDVRLLLGTKPTSEPLRIDRMRGTVRDGHALRIGSQCWLYCLAPEGRVTILGVHGQADDAFDVLTSLAARILLLVDWRRATLIQSPREH